MLNVAKRIPLLLNKDRKNVGVLHYTAITTELLLQRHLASFDKSITFLRDIMRDLFGNVRRLRNYVEELVALVGEIETSGHPENCIILMFQLQEWMENVYIMYERETLRKKAALKDMDFADVGTLQDAYAGWSIHSRHSFVDSEYGKFSSDCLV